MTIIATVLTRFAREPDFTIWQDGVVYLRRWWLIPRNRRFNVYLHHFRHSDDDRAMHDHPWLNASIILTGAYFEHTHTGAVKLRKAWRPWAPWRMTLRCATSAHRVELIQGGEPTWTLFITGPVVREWGFHCPRGWMPWKQFVEQVPGGNRAGNGCGE